MNYTTKHTISNIRWARFTLFTSEAKPESREDMFIVVVMVMVVVVVVVVGQAVTLLAYISYYCCYCICCCFLLFFLSYLINKLYLYVMFCNRGGVMCCQVRKGK